MLSNVGGKATIQTIRPVLRAHEATVNKREQQERAKGLAVGTRGGCNCGRRQQSQQQPPRQQQPQQPPEETGSGWQPRCYKCKQLGHMRYDCPQLRNQQQQQDKSEPNAIPGKWVFKSEFDADGKLERHKARYVAKGFKPVENVDYSKVFVPTPTQTTVRAFLATAAAEGMDVHHLDVCTVFLHGGLEEVIYVEQPLGFETGEPGQKRHSLKALYGLKQAGRARHKKLVATLEANGFEASMTDPSLYSKCDGLRVVRLLVHAHELLTASNCVKLLAEVKQQLAREFDVRDLGEVSRFLGIEVVRDRGTRSIKISQKRYALDLVQKFGLVDAKPDLIPMQPNRALLNTRDIDEEEQEPFQDATQYRSLVGSLMYLADCTRPDIAQVVNKLSQYMSKPMPVHWEAARGVLRYVKGTAAYGITYSRDEPLFGYADAEWASDRDNRRSTTGYVFMLHGGAVSWKSRLQPTKAASSVEADYLSASSVTCEAMFLRKLLIDLDYPVKAVRIWDDNQGAISLIRNPITSFRSKHIDVQYHFVRERELFGYVVFEYCPTERMVADMLTKPLPEAQFVKFRLSMGVRLSHDAEGSVDVRPEQLPTPDLVPELRGLHSLVTALSLSVYIILLKSNIWRTLGSVSLHT
ncbi:hypothetical protein VaNZ11_016937 [Volvox africanus]|uniref:CCHC-type domain-containing protein n=1 Tax=Volvox africanus TaxID=51714 RepID=A0ABQ5SPV5_9CHLO|nr:hypothetical protein VaNZ11_016937 [Volvox africanus]